jgi:hypothetical protein
MSLAERLLDHAAAVLPAAQRDWAVGMKAELSAIDAPGEALAFAAGCVLAAYRRRINPMRIALVSARMFVAGVTLLTAVFHAFMPAYMLAILADLKLNGMNGFAGRFRMFKGRTADEAISGVLMMPLWHVALMLAMAVAFGACAWFMAKGDMRRLFFAILAGVAAHTANTLTQLALWPTPYFVHPKVAGLNYVAFGLLLVAGLLFFGLGRWTRPKPATA